MKILSNVPLRNAEKLLSYHDVDPATIGHFCCQGFNQYHLFVSVPNKKIMGRALTVRTPSIESVLCHQAASMAEPGDVVMIERMGEEQFACLGGVVARAFLEKKVAGVIVDGSITDIQEIRAMGLPVWYRRLSVVTTRFIPLDQGGVNIPIQCCGAVVNPGDLVLADENGFFVFDPDQALTYFEKARAIQNAEPQKIERLVNGESLVHISRAGIVLKNLPIEKN